MKLSNDKNPHPSDGIIVEITSTDKKKPIAKSKDGKATLNGTVIGTIELDVNDE